MTIQTLGDITSFKWGTITALSPLAVKLDGDTAALSLIPDTLVDPTTLWVGARVRVELSLRRVVIHGVNNGAEGFQSGDIVATARSGAARQGWLMCWGQSLLRVDYPSLFAAIGTTYGAADSTHFNIPNGKGRVLVGLDSGVTEFNAINKSGGATTHTLTEAQIPSHTHGQRVTAGSGGPAIRLDWSGDGNGLIYDQGIATGAAGGGGAHNNLQPYLTVGGWMIKI
ncbi:tail fiber [Microbacterium phage Ixel]|nr:tail fiber [Microbacterium phage Ixel]